MTSKKNAEAKPFTLVRELREMQEARKVRDAANATYGALVERAAATIEANAGLPEIVNGKQIYMARIGKTAALVQEVTTRNTRKIDEKATVRSLRRAHAARQILDEVDAADAISDTGDASREELIAAVEAYREATAAALKALRAVATPESAITVSRVPVRKYSVSL